MGAGRSVDEQQQRDDDADEQPRQRVEDEHAEHGGDGGDEVRTCRVAVDAAESVGVQLVQIDEGSDVDELDHRRDHDGGEGRLGQVLEQRGQEQQGHDREDGDGEPGQLRSSTGRTVDGGLGEAAVDDHAAGQPGADVRGAESDQLPVRIDLVVLSSGVRLGRAEAFGEADEHDARGRRERSEVVVEIERVGQAQRRKAAVDLADDGHPFVGEVERLDGQDAEEDDDERGGDRRRQPAETEQDDQRRETDGEGLPLGVAEVGDDVPHLLEEVVALSFDAEELGDLADDDRQREADDEPLQHRLGDEVGEEAEPRQPGDEREESRGEGEQRREGGEILIRPAGGQVGHRRRRQRGGRRHRPDDEMPAAAERRVEDQRGRGGVQADDRRDAGDRGVGQRLGHQHRPDGQPGDDVAAQPAPVVSAERGEHRQPRSSTGRRGHRRANLPDLAQGLSGGVLVG